MLELKNTTLVVVDVQGKLANLMYKHKTLLAQTAKMVAGAKALNLPICWTEQNPSRLGGTAPEIASLLKEEQPIEKMAFSCFQNPNFKKKLETTACKQVLLIGIEAHICVYQTALELQQAGYEVHLVTDAVSSRTRKNKELALRRLEAEGVKLSSVEMALFELLKIAQGDAFKEVLQIIK